ncbi:ABC transporter substrate-binding protein [Aminobacter sp. Piv2-1]|uniref:ABC transporter substrate-binding protein n=1 Tax=Aminobacter sp. Piv2-1 TaxID=3031122 RepID=UPI0030AB8469
MISRRSLLAALGILAVAGFAEGGLVSPALAQEKQVKLQLAWLYNAASAGEIVALKKGYFAEKGLAVEILPGGPNSNTVQETLSGVAQIATAYAPEIMYAANQGLPIKTFGAAFQKAPLTFYSLGEANIKSVADWKGKRIGAGQGATAQVKAVLDHSGLKFEDITFIQAQIPGLLQDQVDVVASWPTNVAQNAPILQHPGGYNTQSIWDNGLQFQSNYYIARSDLIESDGDMLAKFLEACDKGWAYAADHPEEAIDMVASMSSAIEKDKELASLKVIVADYIYTDETREYGFANISKDRWNATLQTYAKIGEIKPELTAEDVFDGRALAVAKRTKR